MEYQTRAEKILAMKGYQNGQFLYRLIAHSVIALTCGLLCFSFPYWFPSPTSSINHFVFVSIPYVWSCLVNPKGLFVVVNIIVVFLIGESKVVGSHSVSQTGDIYNEYVERSRSLRSGSTAGIVKGVERKVEINLKAADNSQDSSADDKKPEEDIKEVSKEVVFPQKLDKEVEGGDEEEDGLMGAEELNRRVEEFIARVNKQRRLEARL